MTYLPASKSGTLRNLRLMNPCPILTQGKSILKLFFVSVGEESLSVSIDELISFCFLFISS
jgi:hypothetical protein